MNSTYNTMGNNIHELTLYQLQQKAQLLLQQNSLLATQLQLNRSQSMYNQSQAYHQQQQQQPMLPKQPAQRSLSDLYYNPTSHTTTMSIQQQQQKPMSPPGLCSSLPVSQQQSQSHVLAQLPQPPCIALQRRDSVKSDGSQPQVESGRYKTEMCRPFEETGHCRYGAKCQFAHGINELRGLNRHPRYKTEFCRTFHTTGFCSYGQRCNFIHNEDERRPAQSQSSSPTRPHHMPLTVTSSTASLGSTGSSPANSIYGGDLSPTHSPSYLSEDPFSSRLSPAPSLSSFNSDFGSNVSFPSPPGTPLHSDCDYSEATTLSSALEMGLSLSLLQKLNF